VEEGSFAGLLDAAAKQADQQRLEEAAEEAVRVA
jgi:hypothetical protein